ncbi:MAG TPA: hypothetical protein GXZ47_03220 [Treponema sp.]|nr:hypothetical protein [Treponema sp.]
MNQDQIKEMLLSIEETSLDFSVTFTGKKSKKVNGLYKPDTLEILIHNENFTNESQLVYTAIHEYAHHLQCEADGVLRSARAHSAVFWARFHRLLEKAEKMGLYRIDMESSPELSKLTEEIQEKYLAENGRLMKELGKLLMRAHEICNDAGIRYEDYIDRVLCLPRVAAKAVVKIGALDINPAIGYENMKTVAAQPTAEGRAAAEEKFTARRSPDSVKTELSRKLEAEDPVERLAKEKIRLEKTIATLTARLEKIEESLRSSH